MKMRSGTQQKPAVPKGKAVAGTPRAYFSNSRTPVHPNFDRHASVGRKTELKERRK